MFVLALTGSIGMGKSTTRDMFARRGVPVFDADTAVHKLYAGAAAPVIEAAFPGTTSDGLVDRRRLGALVLNDDSAMRRLETIIHPLVADARQMFIAESRAAGAEIVLLDMPLLFEIGAEKEADAIVVVTAPEAVQKARVLARPGVTPAYFAAMLAKQTPDAEKRRRADFIIDTAQGLAAAERQVDDVLAAVAARIAES
jgi:dephospho-CoA kinase